VQTNATYLSIEVHYKMAMLVMSACSTHLVSKQILHIFTDGHTQASDNFTAFMKVMM